MLHYWILPFYLPHEMRNEFAEKCEENDKAGSLRLGFIIYAIDILYTSCYDVYHKEGYIVDIQLKRGLLDVCVLTAIKDGESYGYQIIKDMKPYMDLSESTLYTILKRLENADMLTVRTAEHGGRLRKYYRITQAGVNRIEEFKEDWKEILSIYRFVTKEDAK